MNSTFKLFHMSKKYFSVLPKAPKLEMTMRSPYRTFFKNFTGFTRVYVNTIGGQMAIGNRTIPTMYLLPAGEIKVIGASKGEGNLTDPNSTGEFVHSGGWV